MIVQNRVRYLVALLGLSATLMAACTSGPSAGAPPPTTDADAKWSKLRQPLRLPSVSPGSACPISTVASAPDPATQGLAMRAGPAFSIFAATRDGAGTYHYGDSRVDDGWYYVKNLWVVDPEYKGPVLVRGKRIDGLGELRFEGDGGAFIEVTPNGTELARERRFPEELGTVTSDWREYPGSIRFRSPGCYAIQVNGAGFADAIIFRVAF